MSVAERLYTPELLGLAVELAQWPLLADPQVYGEARSPTCGSTLDLSLALDDRGRIERLGMRVRACAVGQAAAAIFARHAVGRDLADITAALEAFELWLVSGGDIPDWPRLGAIAPARTYPGRHGAMLLPWKAAAAALSSTPADR
jgi:NifU-like protein involved in Fe-S cluster formation